MHKIASLFPFDPRGDLERLVNTIDYLDLAAIGLAGSDTIGIRGTGHHNFRSAAQLPRRKCGSDGVIARAYGRDAPVQLLPGQRMEICKRAAGLEGAGALQEFQLTPDARVVAQREFDPGTPHEGRGPDAVAQQGPQRAQRVDRRCSAGHG